MRDLSLLLLFVGSLLLVSGLMQQKMRKEKHKMFYKVLPSTIYNNQFQDVNRIQSLPALFDKDYNRFYR